MNLPCLSYVLAVRRFIRRHLPFPERNLHLDSGTASTQYELTRGNTFQAAVCLQAHTLVPKSRMSVFRREFPLFPAPPTHKGVFAFAM